MTNPISPDRLEELARGYQEAQLLLTANYLGVFKTIGHEAKTLNEINHTLHTSERGMGILLDALASLQILHKQNDHYINSNAVKEMLLPDSPQHKTAMFLHHLDLYQRWGYLYQAVRSGEKIPEEAVDSELQRNETAFAKAMSDAGRQGAQETAENLDLNNVRRLLDLGGGPGIYSIEFAKRNPAMQITLFDTEETLQVAQDNIQQAGLSKRIQTKSGDALTDEFGKDYDFIFLSNFIHIFSFELNKQIVEKCAASLATGGRLCIKDFILQENRIEPQWTALFRINMLVNTDGGDCYTEQEVIQWFKNAGLEHDRTESVAVNSSLIIGHKL